MRIKDLKEQLAKYDENEEVVIHCLDATFKIVDVHPLNHINRIAIEIDGTEEVK